MKKPTRSDRPQHGVVCNCRMLHGRLHLCDLHKNAPHMAALLNALRRYFLDSEAGERSPFVHAIDALVPRHDQPNGGGA